MKIEYDRKFICDDHGPNNERADVFLSKMMSISRTKAADTIKEGLAYRNGQLIEKLSMLILLGDVIAVAKAQKREIKKKIDLNLKIIHESDDFIVIDKPPFVSCHESNHMDSSYTIADWIIDNDIWRDELSGIERAGIVHRLDKNTSGILLIAKNFKTQDKLMELFKNRKVKKQYDALTIGKISKQGYIKYKITRNPLNPTRMTHSIGNGKDAETEYLLIKEYEKYNHVQFFPKTGRTHQIRVHASAIGASILGDVAYGKQSSLINRHALHASSIEFSLDGNKHKFKSAIPRDIMCLIEK
jgi:23S rRNA pseudouridine1911/1915/1917 synthase